jgi:hypothetical protein
VMSTENIGSGPNDAFTHAEITLTLRAAREKGDLTGRTIEVQLDRDVCGSCQLVLPLLAMRLGNPTMTFLNYQTGKMWVARDGAMTFVGHR